MLAKESMTAIQNDDDDACSRKTTMTCDYGGGARPWSDLTHDVLFLVMMQLGIIDFVAFKGVCKSWRSLAFSYMNTFLASRPPMFMSVDDSQTDEDVECCCHLEDHEGRRFKTVLPHSAASSICLGITCGYLIIYGIRTRDFWLVNLITRHELHFPQPPREVTSYAMQGQVSAILVFSPSISGGWVFLVLNVHTHDIWFSTGKSGAWDHVSSTVPMVHLHFFKGKIYTLHASLGYRKTKIIGVMKLDPKESKLTLLETKNLPSSTRGDLVCSDENLYLLQQPSFVDARREYKAYKLDFGEMKWVVENTSQEYAFFLCYQSQGAVVRPESWRREQFRKITSDDLCGNERFFVPEHVKWYFPHECPNNNRMDE